jgi:peptidyl-Lys metalloendopeptidase
VGNVAYLKRKWSVLLTILSLLLFSIPHALASDDDYRALAVEIELVGHAPSQYGVIKLRFIYTNTSDQTISIAQRGTALEDALLEDLLLVERNGEVLPYSGPIAKRLMPTASDTRRLLPSEAVQSVVEIQDAYDFTVAGEYHLTAKQYTNKKSVMQPAPIIVTVNQPPKILKQTPGFQSCSSQYQSIADSALSVAEFYSVESRNALFKTPLVARPRSPRYITWFGAYQIDRWNKVQSNYVKISNALSNQKIQFNCACDAPGIDKSSTVAYVYSNRAYEINLCPIFWRLGTSGVESKAGVLIHEISHFVVVSDTDDHVYGQRGSKGLAARNPALAISNADNYEYFSENPGGLSMVASDGGGDGDPGIPISPEPEPKPKYGFLSAILGLLLDPDGKYLDDEPLPDDTATEISSSFEGRYEISLLSEKGDLVGGGKAVKYHESNSNLSISLKSNSQVELSFEGWGEKNSQGNEATAWSWNMRNYSSNSMPVGVYQNGISVSNDRAKCRNTVGTFRVFEIDIRAGQVVRLLADFEQHCNLNMPKLLGTIDFDSNRDAAIVDYSNATPPPPGDLLPSTPYNAPIIALHGEGDNFFGLVGKLEFDHLTYNTISQKTIEDRVVTTLTSTGKKDRWEFNFGASDLRVDVNKGERIVSGVYPFAATSNGGSPAPILDVKLNGVSCENGVGSFAVQKADFSIYRYRASQFDVTFEYRCPGYSGHISGGISYDILRNIPPVYQPLDISQAQPPVFPSLENAGAVLLLDLDGSGEYVTYGSLSSNIRVTKGFYPHSRASVKFAVDGVIKGTFSDVVGQYSDQLKLMKSGIYTPALASAAVNANFPSMIPPFSADCYPVAGMFRVFDIAHDDNAEVTRLKMDFEWGCEQGGGVRRGILVFDNTLPPHQESIEPVETALFPAVTEPSYAGGVARYKYKQVERSYSYETGHIDVQPMSNRAGVYINASSLGERTVSVYFQRDLLDIYPSSSAQLTPGVYRPQINGTLYIDGGTSVCNKDGEQVARIHEIAFSPAGDITRLVADFETTCADDGSVEYFSVRHNLDLPSYPIPDRPLPSTALTPALPAGNQNAIRFKEFYFTTGEQIFDRLLTGSDLSFNFSRPHESGDKNVFQFIAVDSGQYHNNVFRFNAQKSGLIGDPSVPEPFTRGVYNDFLSVLYQNTFNCDPGELRIFEAEFSEELFAYTKLVFDYDIPCPFRKRRLVGSVRYTAD